jgi:hypothetical protein
VQVVRSTRLAIARETSGRVYVVEQEGRIRIVKTAGSPARCRHPLTE